MHAQRRGPWRNWQFTLHYLLRQYPSAKLIMIVQDDTVFAGRGLRDWCEYNMNIHLNAHRSQPVSLYSLYTPLHYGYEEWGPDRWRNGKCIPLTPGWHPQAHGASLWGACCFVFPREMADALTEDKWV